MIAADRRSLVRGHPFLVTYLVALAVVWLLSVATWAVDDGTPSLAPLAQWLQYLLVVVAATLAALRLRVEPQPMRADALFGFGQLRWTVEDDVGGRTFWTAIGVGMLAMLVNVILFVLADLVVTGGGDVGEWLEWIGSGIGAGAIIGLFSSLIALVVATITSAVRRRA